MNSQTYSPMHEMSFTTKMKECGALTKPHLSLSIGFSAFFGSSLAVQQIGEANILVAIAIFLLACGCSCLNNVQDRHLDTCFLRTKARALAQKRIPLTFATGLATFLIILPISMLFYYAPNTKTGMLAIVSVFFYNALYTPLKKNSVLAILPGIICGMLPVLIGYHAMGGHGFPPHVVIACTILMAWQIPHTWLVILQYFPDYKKNTLPSFLDLFGPQVIKRLIFIWVLGIAVLMMGFAASLGVGTSSWLIAANALIMSLVFSVNLSSKSTIHYRGLFIHLNISLFVMMIISMAEKL